MEITSRNCCFFDDNSTLTRQHILAATSTDFYQTFATIYHRSKTFFYSPKTPLNHTLKLHPKQPQNKPKPQPTSTNPPTLSTITSLNLYMPLTQQQKRDLNIIDLGPYTMASKEAINAKFKALEARMEDKIRTLFTELRLGWPLSPKKSHQGESFAQSHQARRDEFQWRGGSMTDHN